ncbi:diguanylate cyclase/phosphodiesterase [Rhodovulum sp. PH10]|nr:diguanylate cyclase/phosphodiesterase [Rhodovulum sp. PH10]
MRTLGQPQLAAALGVVLAGGVLAALVRAAFLQVRRRVRSRRSLAASLHALDHAHLRLVAAVDNMSQGLCMFDRDERLVLCNARYREMYHLTGPAARPGILLADLLRERAASGTFTEDVDAYRLHLRDALASGRRIHLQTELPDGRIVAVVNQPMPDGGWVATHEDITERQRALWQIAHMARHDALTDLANRLLFSERMDDALARLRLTGDGFVVLTFDLDLFKAVNDSLGHPVGDGLLRAVAQRLRDAVPSDCTTGRLGGDEFAILQPAGLMRRDAAAALATILLAAIGAPYDIDGNRIEIGISIGIALAPDHGDDTSTLLKNADLALYRAKAAGRHCYRFFEAEMDAEARMHHVLEIDLRNALSRAEFELHYQPVVDIASQRPCGVEALVRWRHPVFGLIPPDRFIPIAEETGLIAPIGEWILRRACTDAASLPPDVTVAVNLSPIQLRSAVLVETVQEILAEAGLPASRLELEITESVLLQRTSGTLGTLHRLGALGIGIVLDDFGVGYSSLGYLRLFPFTKIKIDKAFVGEMGQRSDCAVIVGAISGLARALDMKTTAEGVETADQFALVRAAGCTQAQGWLFGRPVPIAALDFSETPLLADLPA